jgi:hypothetical protein
LSPRVQRGGGKKRALGKSALFITGRGESYAAAASTGSRKT